MKHRRIVCQSLIGLLMGGGVGTRLSRASAMTVGAATASAAAATTAARERKWSDAKGLPLTEVASLRWLCNAVALRSDGRLFLGLPRWQSSEDSPSVAEVMLDGSLRGFPGGDWNDWHLGKPTANAFVSVNTIHIFDDDTLWVVDQGQWRGKLVDDAAFKILQFDTRSGELLKRITFAPDVLPLDQGAMINDLRLSTTHAYFTDSGRGAIVVHDFQTGKSMRRLAAHPSTKAQPTRPPIGENGHLFLTPHGGVKIVNADPIEISPDGRWLYYQALTGPLYRVPVAALNDVQLDERGLGQLVELVYDTPPLTGTAIDSKGNLYFAEMDRPRISAYTPSGRLIVLAEDDRLWGPDAMFISSTRELYIPVPQTGRLAGSRGPQGKDRVQRPWKIFKLTLPADLGDREAVPPG